MPGDARRETSAFLRHFRGISRFWRRLAAERAERLKPT